MDMLFVKVDETVKVNDQVELIKDNNHIYEIADHLDTISYELACSLTSRVPRIYK
jgi:alanine racemase